MNQAEAFRETVDLAERCGMPDMPGSSLGLDHLRSMLATVSAGGFSDTKLGRWLGWAQCAVVAADIGVSLDDMKAINLRHRNAVRDTVNQVSAEQQARDLLERMGVDDAQSYSSGELVELANLISEKGLAE